MVIESENQVMETTDIVGDVVQVFLRESGEFASLGFEKPSYFLKVMGVEELGIWVAHPGYAIAKVNDEEGKPLPADEQIHTVVDANFLIRWDQIATIVHFPDREGFDFPSPFEKHIGFVVPTEEAEGEEEDS
ncbi:MAG: hypothetical protein JSU77_12675 [Fidelibacterota bacterium]|nr:MAG: hypothetical protein JSU77_12675 [Candidatus Neomarinimicrobiota bacterium]